MNSEKLEKKHQKIYKTFFSNNDLVVSGYFNFPWGYEGISNNLSLINLKLKSQSPFKCYIGFKLTESFNITFKNVIVYNIVKKDFEKRDYIELINEKNKIIDLLKSEIKKLGFKKGIEINILTETLCGHSFGFSGTSGALISYGIYVLYSNFLILSKINEEKILKDYYDEITSLAGKMDFISRYGNSNIHNIFFTLNGVKGISYFLFKDYVSYNSLKNIKNIKYKMGEIMDSNNLNFPFDYYLVFSGIPTDTKQVEYYKRIEFHDNSIAGFIKKNLFKKYKYDKNAKFDMINIEKIKIFELLYKINKKPYDENLVDSLINQVNKYRYIIGIYETQNSFAEDFRFFFRQNKTKTNEIVGICPNYTGKLGGGYIVITKHGLSRNTIEKTISKLKNLYSNIEVEFSSFDNPISGKGGVKIDQFISIGLFSKFINKSNVLYMDNKNNHFFGDYNEIINFKNDVLILDTIGNKIYFNGVKLTSNDIPSQSATIELLIKILENKNNNISNKDLSISSYSKNRNEMLGKIILPLIKFIENKTKEKFFLTCSGGLNNFYIKLGKSNAFIGVIKNV